MTIKSDINWVNPRTLEHERLIHTDPADLPQMVEQARMSGIHWSQMTLNERADRLIKLGRMITARREEGAELLAQETGRASSMLALSELNNVLTFISACIKEAKYALKPTKVKLSSLDWPGKSVRVEQVPRGVIGIIAPWNYPISNFYKSLFPALLAGNTVVIKPSEFTPRVGAWLAEVARETLGEGIVNCVQGGAVVGAALIDAGIDAIVFTGSVTTGEKVAIAAAKNLIPCSLELGGKDAALVLADAEIERSALGIAQWSMFNSGQDCSSIERLYIVESIADQFLSTLTKIIANLSFHGDGTLTEEDEADVGPLQNQSQLHLVQAHVESAVKSGAKVLCGGEITGQGYGFKPTLLDHCNDRMTVVTDETFGPVLAVVRVPNIEEAITQINRSQYGLNGSVWTKDIKLGEHIARRFEVGVALVNNHSFTGSLPQTPWTGVKQTGYGVASSRWAYHTFVRPKTVVIDKNKGPDPFWLPIDDSYRQFVEAVALKNLGGGIRVMIRLVRLLGRRIRATRSLLK
jgi:acyl-CoA reductase-like NAD-dependent aldehyde dehydrogenase